MDVNNLVTVLHCADCGSPLGICKEQGNNKHPISYNTNELNPPLESSQVHMVRISVYPCDKCKAEYGKPVFALADLLKDVAKLKEKHGK